MSDPSKSQREDVRRKVEEVADLLQPVREELKTRGFDHTLEANNENGVISMTIKVYVLERDT